MAAKIFRINYKSDFILTMNSDAGWAIPFCIKFWTSVPSRAYFVGFDGVKYVNCRVGDTPMQLLVMFDDHHLPIGKLEMQIAYHTTIEEFPGSVFDEVTNARDVIVTIDGTDYQVMLDFTGEDAPELEFDLPAYANEAERIQNELQRQQNEADRIAAELQREQATAAAVQGAENVNAQLNGTTLTVTNRQGVSTSVNTKGEQGEQGPVGPEGPQGEQGETGISIVSFTPKSETSTTLIYTVTFSDGTTQDVAIPKGAKGDTGATGPQGPQGDTGVSITGLVKTGETDTDTLYNVTFSNGTTQQVSIPKGEKGDTGSQGPAGPQGPQGDTVILGDGQNYILYNVPGQNTDGAMTQKAVTDEIQTKITETNYGQTITFVQGLPSGSTGDIVTANDNVATSFITGGISVEVNNGYFIRYVSRYNLDQSYVDKDRESLTRKIVYLPSGYLYRLTIQNNSRTDISPSDNICNISILRDTINNSLYEWKTMEANSTTANGYIASGDVWKTTLADSGQFGKWYDVTKMQGCILRLKSNLNYTTFIAFTNGIITTNNTNCSNYYVGDYGRITLEANKVYDILIPRRNSNGSVYMFLHEHDRNNGYIPPQNIEINVPVYKSLNSLSDLVTDVTVIDTENNQNEFEAVLISTQSVFIPTEDWALWRSKEPIHKGQFFDAYYHKNSNIDNGGIWLADDASGTNLTRISTSAYENVYNDTFVVSQEYEGKYIFINGYIGDSNILRIKYNSVNSQTPNENTTVVNVVPTINMGLPDDVPVIKIYSELLTPDASNNSIAPLTTDKNEVGDVETDDVTLQFISNSINFTDNIAIAYQGQTSVNHPKKNFSIDLNNKHRFGHWIGFDSFHLKGFYTDWIHCRDWIANRMWEQILTIKETSERRPYMISNDFNNDFRQRVDQGVLCHVDGFPCELYINDVYWGLYTWRSKKHRDNYMFEKNNVNHIFLDESGLLDGHFDWTQMEVRNPKKDSGNSSFDEGTVPNPGEVKTAVEAWVSKLEAITNSTSKEYIETFLNMDAMLDYLVFQEYINAWDMFARNTLWGTWDGSKFSCMPYDLDSCFGYNGLFESDWSNILLPYDFDVFSKHAYKFAWLTSLRNIYATEIRQRYYHLRKSGILSVENIQSLYDTWTQWVGYDVYKRDTNRWHYPDNGYGIRNNRDSVERVVTYMTKRTEWLDQKYGFFNT